MGISVKHIYGLNEINLRKEVVKNDIVIVPSLLESFSLGFLECLNAGLLFITTSRHGIVEKFPNNFNDYVYNYHDSKKLATNILKLFNLNQKQKLNKSKIIRNFTFAYIWDKVVSEYLEIYKGIDRKS